MRTVKKEPVKEKEAIEFNPDELIKKISRKSALELLKSKEEILRILDGEKKHSEKTSG